MPGLVVFEPDSYSDARGRFHESFRSSWFEQDGTPPAFLQDNVSVSGKSVIRGLHFQNPDAQGKLVQVLHGSAFDVAVDLRAGSATFGEWYGLELSAQNNRVFWIPAGFAHGFQSLEDGTVFHYKCTGYYNPRTERSVRWNDPRLAIEWPLDNPVVSPKDEDAPLLSQLDATELF